VVATFHTSQIRSRAMSASASILRPSLEKITGRIAVSEYARDTLVHHVGGEPVVIPNGVYVDRYAGAALRPTWRGSPTVAYVGRLDEPRKGLDLLLEAFPAMLRARPGARLLVVGGGDIAAAQAKLPEWARPSALFLGRVDDDDKASALRTADLYVAPNTGGESFGIVLIEAMAAGAVVLASDLPAFRRVLGNGAYGVCFRNGDVQDLERQAVAVLGDADRCGPLRAAASHAVLRYDWSTVAGQVIAVYETVAGGGR
jgi:phosphatidyl-myo-inositol alpha-mannosyltransferase